MGSSPACELTIVAWSLGGLTLDDLWWRYLGEGGNHNRLALAEYLGGHASWATAEHNILAQALNEALWDLDCPSVAPRRDIADPNDSAVLDREEP